MGRIFIHGKMVEVFKTNVADRRSAKKALDAIHKAWPHYAASFDLEDCDRVLRIEAQGEVQTGLVMDVLRGSGIGVEILPG